MRSAFNLYLLNAALSVRSVEKKIFSKYKLSYAKFLLLNILIKKGEPVYPSFLAEKMHVSNANMTGLIMRMKKDALISKQSDKLDKRAYFVDVTPFGKKLYEQVLPEFLSFIEEIMTECTQGELVNLLNTQKVLYGKFSKEVKGIK